MRVSNLAEVGEHAGGTEGRGGGGHEGGVRDGGERALLHVGEVRREQRVQPRQRAHLLRVRC